MSRAIVPRRLRMRCQGFSLIELMVGVTLGLLVLMGATGWVGQTLGSQHRQRQAWQLHQELRAVAAQVQMELRRAGGHGRPSLLVWRPDAAAAANPFSAFSIDDAGRLLQFSRAQDDVAIQPGSSERSGFRWTDQRVDQLIGGRFQPLTDPVQAPITSFSAAVDATAVPWSGGCGGGVLTRSVRLLMEGQPALEPAARQRLELVVHLRNDSFLGGC